jgi:AcrR family transcriptional regulator
LCEAATKLFLERGVESATVDEITREAGVAKGSFYRYFEDKEQLVDALFAPLESEVEQAMKRCAAALSQASGDEQLNQAYATLAAELAAQLLEAPALVKLYLQECRAPAEGARKPIRRLSQKLMDGAIALSVVAHDRGLIRDLPPQVTAVAVVGAVEGMLVQYFEGHQLDVGEATAALISMVVDGIRKR